MMPRFMPNPSLPQKIKPWRSSANNATWHGSLAVSSLPRVMAAVSAALGEVEIALHAGRDAQGFDFIQGRLRAQVELVCQRCLGALQQPLLIDVSLGLVRDEAAIERLPAHYEPLIVAEEQSVSFAELIEDELLLALPHIPRHAHAAECAPPSNSPTTATQRPFAALASLLADSTRSH